jgi:hypothetical protein
VVRDLFEKGASPGRCVRKREEGSRTALTGWTRRVSAGEADVRGEGYPGSARQTRGSDAGEMKLKNTLKAIRGEDLITHLGPDYYE